MNWEDAIPSIAAERAEPRAEPVMNSDEFAEFYQRTREDWARGDIAPR